MFDRILNSKDLPSPPSVAFQLLEYTRDPDSTIGEFVSVIRQDPAMSAKILKAANSAFFSFRSEIASLDRAVAMIGRKPTATLVLSFSLIEQGAISEKVRDLYQEYWLQSVIQAITAETLAQRFHKGLESEAFLIGLLLDIGRLAMLRAIPNEYGDTLNSLDTCQFDLHDWESKNLGFSHIDVGCKLLDEWKLPPVVIDSVAQHHHVLNPNEIEQLKQAPPLHKIALFASNAGDWFCTGGKGRAFQRLNWIAREIYKLGDSELEALLSEIKGRVDLGASLFSVSTSEIGTTADLLSQARNQLSEMAFLAQVQSAQFETEKQAIESQRIELQQRNQKLESEVIRDNLTGIFTRKYFDEIINKEFSRCSRNQLSASILFCDIDNFKLINDTYGHATGDRVIQQTALVIQDAIRTSDTLARYGGEEFVVLLVDINQENTKIVGKRILESVQNMVVYAEDQSPIAATISIGCCLCNPVGRRVSPSYIQSALQSADDAMYHVKKNGRNGIHFLMLDDVNFVSS